MARRSSANAEGASTPAVRAGNLRTGDLTSVQRQLLQLLHEIDRGYVSDLVVRDGQPVLDPPPRVMRERLLKRPNEVRVDPPAENYALKEQMVELFNELQEVGDGLVFRLEVQAGLPYRILTEGLGRWAVRLFPSGVDDGKA